MRLLECVIDRYAMQMIVQYEYERDMLAYTVTQISICEMENIQ
jgi:hypothetical protein